MGQWQGPWSTAEPWNPRACVEMPALSSQIPGTSESPVFGEPSTWARSSQEPLGEVLGWWGRQ